MKCLPNPSCSQGLQTILAREDPFYHEACYFLALLGDKISIAEIKKLAKIAREQGLVGDDAFVNFPYSVNNLRGTNPRFNHVVKVESYDELVSAVKNLSKYRVFARAANGHFFEVKLVDSGVVAVYDPTPHSLGAQQDIESFRLLY